MFETALKDSGTDVAASCSKPRFRPLDRLGAAGARCSGASLCQARAKGLFSLGATSSHTSLLDAWGRCCWTPATRKNELMRFLSGIRFGESFVEQLTWKTSRLKDICLMDQNCRQSEAVWRIWPVPPSSVLRAAAGCPTSKGLAWLQLCSSTLELGWVPIVFHRVWHNLQDHIFSRLPRNLVRLYETESTGS